MLSRISPQMSAQTHPQQAKHAAAFHQLTQTMMFSSAQFIVVSSVKSMCLSHAPNMPTIFKNRLIYKTSYF